jgi:hypothetical protein
VIDVGERAFGVLKGEDVVTEREDGDRGCSTRSTIDEVHESNSIQRQLEEKNKEESSELRS